MEKSRWLNTNFHGHIYNMDETGILTVEEPGIILALKGQKRVSSVTTW